MWLFRKRETPKSNYELERYKRIAALEFAIKWTFGEPTHQHVLREMLREVEAKREGD